MNLANKILSDMRGYLKLGESEKDKLVFLRMVVSSLEKEKINLKLKDVNDLSDESVVTILQKQVKLLDQELESLKIAKRDTMKVEAQKELVKKYLPTQMNEEELNEYIKIKVEELKIDSIKMQGKLMGVASKELKGKADLGLFSKLVRDYFN